MVPKDEKNNFIVKAEYGRYNLVLSKMLLQLAIHVKAYSLECNLKLHLTEFFSIFNVVINN